MAINRLEDYSRREIWLVNCRVQLEKFMRAAYDNIQIYEKALFGYKKKDLEEIMTLDMINDLINMTAAIKSTVFAVKPNLLYDVSHARSKMSHSIGTNNNYVMLILILPHWTKTNATMIKVEK